MEIDTQMALLQKDIQQIRKDIDEIKTEISPSQQVERRVQQ